MKTQLKRCIGFRETEGKCRNPIASPSPYWCEECEQARRAYISERMEALPREFEELNRKMNRGAT